MAFSATHIQQMGAKRARQRVGMVEKEKEEEVAMCWHRSRRWTWLPAVLAGRWTASRAATGCGDRCGATKSSPTNPKRFVFGSKSLLSSVAWRTGRLVQSSELSSAEANQTHRLPLSFLASLRLLNFFMSLVVPDESGAKIQI